MVHSLRRSSLALLVASGLSFASTAHADAPVPVPAPVPAPSPSESPAAARAAHTPPQAPPNGSLLVDEATLNRLVDARIRANAEAQKRTREAPKAAAELEPAPFAQFDSTWMNGQSRQKEQPLKLFDGALTFSAYFDMNYAFSSHHPKDHTLTGGASVSRHNEIGINLASFGLEWNHKNVIGRVAFQYGNLLNIVQDLDGTVARGRSLTAQNLRYIREATAGYHFDVGKGLNVEGGIFMSYIGLESYLLAENWNYTRSIVCDHTPFYFQGVRAQYFPTSRIKIEPWVMNGWQSYGKWNAAPSAGLALRYTPTEAVTLIANFYGGTDTKGVSGRVRVHHDNSILVRYFDAPMSSFLSKAAFSLNTHAGFETGGEGLPGPEQAHMVGTSLVSRTWFAKNYLALALRGEVFSNPSSYLAQYPPPGFASGAGTAALRAAGLTATFDVLPSDTFAFRAEISHRWSSRAYYAGPDGTTSADGFQPVDPAFAPDVRNDQTLFVLGLNARL